VLFLQRSSSYDQNAPAAPDRSWHSPEEQKIERDAKTLRTRPFSIDPDNAYTLPELIGLAEAQNPQTSVAWERTRSRAAALGIARSELHPTLVAVALSQFNRAENLFGTTFLSQTVEALQASLELNYRYLTLAHAPDELRRLERKS
jgi:outer membrane protein TolC